MAHVVDKDHAKPRGGTYLGDGIHLTSAGQTFWLYARGVRDHEIRLDRDTFLALVTHAASKLDKDALRALHAIVTAEILKAE